MFKVLLESRGTRERRSSVGVVSACVHAALIVGAAVATTGAEPAPVRPPTEDTTLVYHAPRAPEPWQLRREPASGGAARRDEPGPVVPMPAVPSVNTDGIPPVDVALDAFTRAGAAADALAAGRVVEGMGGSGMQRGGVYGPGDRYVEKPVVAAPGSAQPRYPEMLRQAGVEGAVEVEFVVDTLGRAEPGSLRILRSDHELFAAAVRSALPAMRFLPAEAGGRRVRQLVRQPFSFAVRGR